MTAAVLYGKEDVKIERVPIPTLEDGEVLVKVQVALTCGTDLKVYQRGYHARMIVPPALFGHELAGVIEEVGPNVKGFKKGMRVVALNSAPCGTCFYCSKHQENLCQDLLFNNGAYAEYIRIPRRIVETNMLAIPKHVSYEEAAMVEPLACVLRGLHETNMEIGDSVAVIGAGPIGLMFVQVAKLTGCNVISVVKRDSQVAAARRVGADSAVQITAVDDPVKAVRKLTPDFRGCDVVIEAVGRPQAWEWSIDMVRKGGTVNFFGGCANGTTVALDTQRLHYNELTLEGDVPSHAGNGAQGVLPDLRKEDQGHGLHHRRSAAVALATGAAAHAQPQWRYQDRHHPGTVSAGRVPAEQTLKTAYGPGRWPGVSCIMGDLSPAGRKYRSAMSSAPADNQMVANQAAAGWHSLPPEYAIPDRAPSLAGGAAILRAAGAFALREFLRRHLVSAQTPAPAFLQRVCLLPDIRRSGRRSRQSRAVSGPAG